MILHTSDGVEFIIDDNDYDLVSQHSWYIYYGYPATGRHDPIHIFLMGRAPEGFEWDHRNRNKLDNRRENLRIVTRAVNMRNRNKRADNRTGVQGVRKIGKGWDAYIQTDGNRMYLGYFKTFEEARDARMTAEKLYWSEDNS